MHVLVLGGTGTIGAAVVRELVSAGHIVSGLARSLDAAEALMVAGAEPVAGDLASPRLWADAVAPEVDAVVHAACTFAPEMGAVDAALLEVLLSALAATGRHPMLLYTGGCWLWGSSPDRVIDETTPFDPLPAFAWMIQGIERVLVEPGVRGSIVHPSMVWTETSGPIAAFEVDAHAGRPLRVIGSERVLWPMIHADDLAVLYRLILDSGEAGVQVIGTADEAVEVGALARAAAARAGRGSAIEIVSEELIVAERGDWARGYARSQRMSSAFACTRFGWRPRRSAMPETVQQLANSVSAP